MYPLLTWTGSDTAHDDLHCLPLTWPSSVLSWRLTAGPNPGFVALTTGTRALLPERPLWPVTIHCGNKRTFAHSHLCKYELYTFDSSKHTHLDRAFPDNHECLRLIPHNDALHWQVEDCYTVSASSGTRHHRTHCKDPTLPTLSSPHELENK